MTKELKYTISADSSKYERAMDRVKQTTASAEIGINRAFKAAGMIGAAAVGAFGLMARETLKAGDNIHKLSMRLGMSTEFLSQMQHAAKLSGTSIDTFATAMRRMERRVSDAGLGLGTAVQSMKDLGLSVNEVMAMNPEQQFYTFAKAIGEVKNQSDKLRIAADVFGGRGVEVLQMIDGGVEGLRNMQAEAQNLGLTLSQEGANKIAAFNDEMVRFKGAIMGAVQSAVIHMGPTATNIIEWFGTKIPQAIDFTVKAFNAIPAIVAIIVNKVVSGLIVFYDVLGKIPVIGEPYREAAAGLREFSIELDNFAASSIAAMETMPQEQDAGKALGIPSTEAMLTAQERLQENMDIVHEMTMANLERRWAAEEAYQKQFEEAERKREADIKATEDRILSYKKQTAANQIAVARGLFTAGLQIAGVEGKKLFIIQKAIDIGLAISAAFRAYTLALAVPPAPNYPLAAMAFKSGMWGVAGIAATAIGQLTAPSGSTGGGTYVSPIVTTPAETEVVPSVEAEKEQTKIEFHIHGNIYNPDETAREFAELLTDYVENKGGHLVASNATYAEAVY